MTGTKAVLTETLTVQPRLPLVQNLSVTCECRGDIGLAWLSSSSNVDSQSLSVGVIGEHQEYVFGIDCVLHFLHIKGYCRC